ncbi:MAG: hypothetical protein U0271_35260 [Polyangiaceae bacterium]
MRWIVGGLLGVSIMGLLSACGAFRAQNEGPEVVVYGRNGKPEDPPDSCKFLEKFEVSRNDNKEPPMDKVVREAQDRGANAVAHVHKTGFSDGYLGKEYHFTVSAYDCPVPKTAASASASGSASAH